MTLRERGFIVTIGRGVNWARSMQGLIKESGGLPMWRAIGDEL
jgi:hypothetical protein